MVCAMKCI